MHVLKAPFPPFFLPPLVSVTSSIVMSLHSEVSEIVQQDPQVSPASQRQTPPYITKYEIAKVIGERAKQIAAGIAFPNNHFAVARKTRESHEWGLGSTRRSSSALDAPSGSMSTFANELRSDPVMIAKYELVDHCIPFVIRRQLPGGKYEDWPVAELEVDPTWLDLAC